VCLFKSDLLLLKGGNERNIWQYKEGNENYSKWKNWPAAQEIHTILVVKSHHETSLLFELIVLCIGPAILHWKGKRYTSKHRTLNEGEKTEDNKAENKCSNSAPKEIDHIQAGRSSLKRKNRAH
jgi:hypothetical protein